MKHQYFGDINDYRKYGIIRCATAAGWRVGVCWMLTPDDGRTDGGKTSYLDAPTRWNRHDPILYSALASALHIDGGRHVRLAKSEGIIPEADFVEAIVPDSVDARRAWFATALTELGGCDLIFFDPDNGLEVRSKPLGARDSSKYLYWHEVGAAWHKRKSLLIFQHFPREKRGLYIPRMMAAVRDQTPEGTVVSLVTSNVLFLLAVRPEHVERLRSLRQALESKWHAQVNIRDEL